MSSPIAGYGGSMTDSSTHTHSYGKGVQAELRDPALALRKEIPEVYDGFKALHEAAFTPGSFDVKTKELIALAIATSPALRRVHRLPCARRSQGGRHRARGRRDARRRASR